MLLVVVFHGWPDLLPGGFVGVDVFFVVSGFVIARAWLHPLLTGERTLRAFYLARFRRLAPALAVVLVATTVGALAVLMPERLVAYGWSLGAQAIYLQNFVFWAEGDYFHHAREKPLLHTWSLAVEEQFYVAWALATLAWRRVPRSVVPLLVAAAAVSLAGGFLVDARSPKTAFFLLPTRIWELVAGVLAFVAAHRIGPLGPRPSLVGIAGVGVAGIAVSALAFDEGARFPGPQAILACGATGALLFALHSVHGHPALAPLRVGPVTYVGRLSYGWYLWHWPPLALAALALGREVDPLLAGVLLALAFVGASASFHLVEEPIRRGRVLADPRALLAFVGGSSAAMALAAGVAVGTGGLVGRFPPEIRPFLEAPAQRGATRCGKLYGFAHPRALTCPLAGAEPGGVLVLGDSHADVVKEAIADAARSVGRTVHLTARNCDLGAFGESAFCSDRVLADLVAEARGLGVTEILAISRWDPGVVRADALARDLATLLDGGFRVTLMRRVPTDPGYDPVLRATAALGGAPLDLDGIPRERYLAGNREVDAELDAAAARFPERVAIVSPAPILCPDATCRYAEDGAPLYVDDTHLTFAGAALLRPMFVDLLRP